MALVRVRHASMFVGSKKVAEMFRNKVALNSGDEPQFGDEGFLGMSDGAITTQLDFDAIVPVSGMTVDLTAYLLNKTDVDITSGPVNGKLYTWTSRCTKAEYDSDSKAGTQTGAFSFMAGVPTVS